MHYIYPNTLLYFTSLVAVWLTGDALVSINVVTLRQAQLVLEWVTILGRVNHLGAEPATQVDSP